MRAHKLLFEWAEARQIQFDVEETDAGVDWAGRLEIYVTDPRTEPRKTRWETESRVPHTLAARCDGGAGSPDWFECHELVRVS